MIRVTIFKNTCG